MNWVLACESGVYFSFFLGKMGFSTRSELSFVYGDLIEILMLDWKDGWIENWRREFMSENDLCIFIVRSELCGFENF